ncbi:RNA polymerase sigma factor [Clostridium sp. ZS2-4]|uniref:RNA polymerase sigma factor n=1 Tax=Clostridium sp. ZS2-4 TaxID=2987703 RepID=UPI00227C6252|nr:sigma-70 family RNA polymerase sigma factor [Clostridium sp. ZS2-4]MCY6355391.1 sigma-70 family RNA polymerase sigma factor [Clostridium sp. ZS2-4]
MKYSLYEIIENIQNGDTEKILDIINKFKPLIKKFSRKLIYEEAETDLTISFIEMIQTMNLNNFTSENEGKIINYINSVIRNKHIDLFRKYVLRRTEEVELNLDILIDYTNNSIEDSILIEDLLNRLPKIQKTVLKEKFIKDHSDIEISQKLNISRQAVNKTKNRALKTLRNYLCVTC